MRNLARLTFLLALCLFSGAVTAPVYAADEAKPVAKPDDTKKDAKKEDGTEGVSKKPDDVSGGRFAGDPVYVHLSPMVLPIITDAGVEQLVTLSIEIQVKDFDTADNLHTNMPKVMDALMRALYGGLGSGALRNGKLVDITRVKAKATTALSQVVAGDGIKDVLILGVAQRML